MIVSTQMQSRRLLRRQREIHRMSPVLQTELEPEEQTSTMPHIFFNLLCHRTEQDTLDLAGSPTSTT